MKAVFFTITLALQFLAVWLLKLLDDFSLIFALMIGSMITGILIRNIGKNPSSTIKDLGWGLICGSLVALILILAIAILGMMAISHRTIPLND